MQMCLAIAFGILVGFVVAKFLLKPKYAGVLLVYNSDPDEPIDLLLDLDIPAEDVSKAEYVTFKVKNLHS